MEEKFFKVNDIPYKIVGDDIWRLPYERGNKSFKLKKLVPTWQLRYKLDGQTYSMYQIEAIFLKNK